MDPEYKDSSLFFAWPTAGQRMTLPESLRGFAENLALYGRNNPLLIAVDSSFGELAPALSECIRHIASAYPNPVYYSDKVARTCFAVSLGPEFDPELSAYAFNYTGERRGPGTNRNAILLAAAGGFVVSTDDDVLCLPRIRPSRPGQKKEPVFSSAPFPLDYLYYPDRESLLSDLRETAVDVAGAHLRFLGSKTEGQPGTVLVTNPGNYGDSGFGRARTVLSLKGFPREHLMTMGYERTKLSREVIRIAETDTVSPSMHFMGMQSGYDSTVALPPFFPLNANEDGFFAMILRICHPESLTAYPDFGFLHDSRENRPFKADSLTGFKPYLSELFMALSVACLPPSHVTDPRERMRLLGNHFTETAALKTGDCVEMLFESWSTGAFAYAEILEDLSETCGHLPESWAQDVEAQLENVYEMLREPTLLFGETGCGLTIEEVKYHLDHYGRLLSVWPDIHDKAVILNAEGRGIVVRLE
jgi:hypothetical protein